MTKYTDNDFPFFDEAEDLTVERSEIQNLPVEQWLAIRKEEALRINPDTALVRWEYRQVLDPYGVNPDLPPECDCVGRVYFAQNPGSDIWVSFYDLPDETRRALYEWMKRQ
jgi:hypothetical protein